MTLHIPVLKEEVIKLLKIKEGDVVVDATLGGGGHSEAILKKIGESGKLVALDLDNSSVERFKSKVKNQKSKNWKNIFIVNANFADLKSILKAVEIEKVNAIIADLGWSSDQMSDPKRGMSFIIDGGLDMRLASGRALSAKEVVNEYGQADLERIIRQFGEEKFYRKIAKEILSYRKNKTIETTLELVEIIRKAIPRRFQRGKIHPATRVFQALRIEVNQELGNLEKFIPQAIDSLKHGGRLAVISFHSLEDRIVKNMFRQNARGCICPRDVPVCVCGNKPRINIITRKPVLASLFEIEENPKARSAKLRICERL